MDIYKDDVIDALNDKREFTVGSFFDTSNDDVQIKDCATCAVGAIVRNAYPNKVRIAAGILCCKVIYNKLNRINWNGVSSYLEALSDFWENLYVDNEYNISYDEMRAITMDWVEEVFPDDEILGTI